MSTKVKICGITNAEDVLWAANLGAHYVGLNFYSESPRKISTSMGTTIVQKTPPFVIPVGVFVNHPVDEVVKIAQKTGIKGVQLHGEETPEDCKAIKEKLPNVFIIKAFRIQDEASLSQLAIYKDVVDYFLLDAYTPDVPGGSGQTFAWGLAVKAKEVGLPIFLAGGLTPENVSQAVGEATPFAVDVASGVEKSPKRKDYDKMKSFIEKSQKVKVRS